MSLSVPTGNKPRSDAELAQLATSPTWSQSPNGWFDRSPNDEDDHLADGRANSDYDGKFDQPGFLDDIDDALPLSGELRASDLDTPDYVPPHYWERIFTVDERSRKAAIATICRALKASLQKGPTSFEHSIPRLVRLLSECPYQDVHDSINELLASCSKELGVHGLSLPPVPRPSRMFKDTVIPLVTDNDPQSTLFKASWLNTGRITHLNRILAWHPTFLEKFTETFDFLLRADGPLPFVWRHYIALIAAARFKSHYIVQQQEQEFILAGGDERWLQSTQHCPRKIQRILEVNAILAHQPWRLQPSHISELLKSNDSAARWSPAELVQAFVIMATFRALAGLAIGMGLNPEVDINIDTDIYDYYHKRDSQLSSSDDRGDAEKYETSTLDHVQLTSRLATRTGSDNPEGDAEQRKQQFEAAGEGENASSSGGSLSLSGGSKSASEASSANAHTQAGSGSANGASGSASVSSAVASSSATASAPASSSASGDVFEKYTAPYPVRHTDFDVRSREYNVFHIQDWSWEEQAYELLERTYDRDFANLIDTEFTTIFELTYHQVNGQEGVDTAPFRRSIWYYVHRIHGILHDDYNYASVNELLLRNLKKFSKDLACTPFQVTSQDLLNLGYSLSPEEKCHIALLATEARKQAELMYALFALSKYLSQ